MIVAMLNMLLAQLDRYETLEAMQRGLQKDNDGAVYSLIYVCGGAIVAIALAAWLARRASRGSGNVRDYLAHGAWQAGLNRTQIDDLRTLTRRARLEQPASALLSPANLSYAVQEYPGGLAQAFLIGKEFIGDSSVALILGDNIFYGHDMSYMLVEAANHDRGATVFAYPVHDPERYGVVEFDKHNKVLSIEEKPSKPRSRYAVTGLYFYDNKVVEFAESIEPSQRGELEITDINLLYLESDMLSVQKMGRGMAWLDTGTHDSLLEAATFIETLEKRQGLKVACPEEIAYRKGYIDKQRLMKLAEPMQKNSYGQYLQLVAEDLF